MGATFILSLHSGPIQPPIQRRVTDFRSDWMRLLIAIWYSVISEFYNVLSRERNIIR